VLLISQSVRRRRREAKAYLLPDSNLALADPWIASSMVSFYYASNHQDQSNSCIQYVCTQREYDTEWSFQMLCSLIGNHVVMEGTFLRKEKMMNQIATTKTTRWYNGRV
jgi:hypothetical protein